jgi:hypothetical protein
MLAACILFAVNAGRSLEHTKVRRYVPGSATSSATGSSANLDAARIVRHSAAQQPSGVQLPPSTLLRTEVMPQIIKRRVAGLGALGLLPGVLRLLRFSALTSL